jgi:predicted ferric reductase
VTGELLWYVARAGGFVAYGLLAASVALGLVASMRIASPRWPRALTTEVHRFVTMAALTFTGIHVVSLVAHPTEGLGVTEVLVPFAADREPLWTALGVVGMELSVAVWLSTRLRSRIGYARWRQLHRLAFVAFGASLVHGIAQGADTGTLWGGAIYMASMGLVGGLLAVRILGTHRMPPQPGATPPARSVREAGPPRATAVAPLPPLAPRTRHPGASPPPATAPDRPSVRRGM